METQGAPTQPLHGEKSDPRQRPLRVEPNYPLSSSFPSSQSMEHSPLTNGMARTISRRRRQSGSELDRSPIDNFPQPPAPEVPKAPPASYRPPYGDNYDRRKVGYPASFAERARALNGNTIPTQPSESSPEPVPEPAKPARRGSLNRPIGGVYTEIQQHKRDSYPPLNGPLSPRRFSNSTSPQQYQGQDRNPFIRGATSGKAQPDNDTTSPNTGISNRRASAEIVQPGPGSSRASAGFPQPETGNRRASAGGVQLPEKEWAQDRSPLQKLEVKLGDISKEEKRARVQEAEQRLRESEGFDRRRSSRQEGGRGVERTQSRRVSAGSGAAKERRLSDRAQDLPDITQAQRSEDKSNSPASEPRLREPVQMPRTDRRRESLPVESYLHDDVGNLAPEPGSLLERDRSGRTSTKAADTQQERGVRFQGEDEELTGYAFKSSKVDSRNRRRSPGTEALARSDAAHSARRERPRENPSIMANRPSSNGIPIEQQQLNSSKIETSKNNALAVTFGGIPAPVSGHAGQGSGHVPKYKIPPQTAAGIQASQAAGFNGASPGTDEAPAKRRHHLSDILHRGHNRAVDTNEKPNPRPKSLDEWRRAGTARLTTADFAGESDSEKDQSAWWEKGGSGSRRKEGRSVKGVSREAHSLSGGYRNDTRKSNPPLSPRNPLEELRGTLPYERAIRTRPYVEHGDHLGLGSAVEPRLDGHEAHFCHRSRPDQISRLSSAYSYSCPSLAIHDPLHDTHFCEPYMSKELTQSMRSIRIRPVPGLTTFDPPLYLKCGPLLRYVGLKRDRLQKIARSSSPSSIERETWRGSVMIVTADADSTYDPVPTLRLFPEPMELLPSPDLHTDEEDGHEMPSEFMDPVAGLPKLSRRGTTVYVKPIDDLEHGRDLSRLENDDGLFEETRTAAVPTAYGTPDYRPGRNGPASSGNPNTGRREGGARKKGQQVKGARLLAERGVTFWRFNLEVELGPQQTRIAYSINNCPAIGFWVPARSHSMNIMFHSCNGFSMSVNPENFSGPDPLWRNVLNNHQIRPFHVMIGGGDQIYNDAIMSQSPLFREWLEIKNPHHKHEADFSPSLREEMERFYLERYSMWFSQGLFGMANSQIPMVNMWDDHDIIDGFGSYPHHFMSTPVFCGLGAVAFKYYMLFQHQTTPDEGPADEPSWLMGAAPGPYINELSRSIFLSLGKDIALLALDCRTERMREEILSEASYELVFERCHREIFEGETKHLIVLLGVPIAYPRLVWLENLVTSRVMEPVKALSRAGMFSGLLNKFDGGVEILDDLDDHWTAKHHKHERNWFVQELQQLAAEKSVRVTILGGDVHLAAVGQFYSNPKLGLPKDRDHRYMVNVISSAIVNTPPPNNLADVLNRRNKTHHLDRDTDEDMIPMFSHDVNGHPRNNKRLLPRRNWCSIREYHPGSTPPPSPSPPPSEPQTPSDEPPTPQTRLQRTLSLTRGDMKPSSLIRRFSKSGPPPSDDYLRQLRENKLKFGDPPSPDSSQNDGYFPQQADLPQRAATITGTRSRRNISVPEPQNGPGPGSFRRRPTNISERAAMRGDAEENADEKADENAGLINLEHGLDIALNCEVNQKDPAGITTPYRLIIPALFYEGQSDLNTIPYRKKRLISRLGSIRGKRRGTSAGGQGQGNWEQQESTTPSLNEGEPEEVRPRKWSFAISQRRQYRDQTPPLEQEPEFEREIREEGTQQQRQFEHRDKHTGYSQRSQPFNMPPSQQKKYEEPSDPLGHSNQNEAGRQDSPNYHTHLDSSLPAGGSGYPVRRLSKMDRMRGVGKAQRSDTEEGCDEHDEKPTRGVEKRMTQGYNGIEAYSEKNNKRWRRFFGSKVTDRIG